MDQARCEKSTRKDLYELQKHKPEKDFPGRLITSGCGSYTENISALVAIELKKCAFDLPHVLRDTNHLLQNIDDINLSGKLEGQNIIHASWDVIAMFPNIPESIGIEKCREVLNSRVSGLSTECIIEALQIGLHYNIAEFDDQWYRQTKGAAMGPHDACFYSDIAMSHFDTLVNSESNPHKKPLFWLRYRDDIYDPWVHGEQELLDFTDWLNTLHPNIQFTLSYKTGEGIEFLDTYIYMMWVANSRHDSTVNPVTHMLTYHRLHVTHIIYVKIILNKLLGAFVS